MTDTSFAAYHAGLAAAPARTGNEEVEIYLNGAWYKTTLRPLLGTLPAGNTTDPLAVAQSGTWTPTFSFDTPGDLAVNYTVRTGRWKRVGDLLFLRADLTMTMTQTTAAGNVSITQAAGVTPAIFPKPANGCQARMSCYLNSGFTAPAGRTMTTILAAANSVDLFFTMRATGGNQNETLFGVSNVNTAGGTVSLGFTGVVDLS